MEIDPDRLRLSGSNRAGPAFEIPLIDPAYRLRIRESEIRRQGSEDYISLTRDLTVIFDDDIQGWIGAALFGAGIKVRGDDPKIRAPSESIERDIAGIVYNDHVKRIRFKQYSGLSRSLIECRSGAFFERRDSRAAHTRSRFRRRKELAGEAAEELRVISVFILKRGICARVLIAEVVHGGGGAQCHGLIERNVWHVRIIRNGHEVYLVLLQCFRIRACRKSDAHHLDALPAADGRELAAEIGIPLLLQKRSRCVIS